MTQEHDYPFVTVEKLWQFSLSYYGVQGVKEACLGLQNQFGGNVNTLLLLKYLDLKQLHIRSEELDQLINATNKTDTLLTHYRGLRKSLKAHLTDALFRDTLKFELLLEQQQQADLLDTLAKLQPTKASQQRLVSIYCQSLGADDLSASFVEPPTNFSI